MNQTGRKIDTVVVDWAGMAVRRYLQTKNKDEPSKVSMELTSYVANLFGLVTARFDAVSWVMHQISGKLNNKPPTYKFHHSEGEWTTSFAVNANFASTLSTKTKATNTCVLRCTKVRRGEPQNAEEFGCHNRGS